MKFNLRKKMRGTLLVRLVLYFLLVVIITLFASGYLTYNFFSSSFKGEITNFNNIVLKQLSIFSDDFLFKNINKMIFNLAMEDASYSGIMTEIDNPLKNYPSMIYGIHDKLSSIVVSNSEFIDSISIHSKKNNLLITSHFVKKIDGDSKTWLDDFSWLDTFYESNQPILWFDTRRAKLYSEFDQSENGSNIITVACSYPLSSTGSDIEGCIAFNIKEKAINSYLMMYNSSDLGQLLIIDNKGTIISHSDESYMYTDISTEPYVQKIINSVDSQSFETKINDEKYVVSYIPSKNKSWHYVSLIPTKLLYQKNYYIMKTLLLASTIILFVVFILSNLLSFKIYIPFKRILDKYSTTFNDGNQLGGTNEYQMMECLFSNASDKIDNFKNILKKNESMIRHNFLVDILNKHFKNPDNMKDIINFAGINFNKQYYSVTFLTFNSRQANNAIKQQQIQYIKYSIIDYINSIESTLYHLYPVDTGSTSVSVITNSDVNNRDVIKQLINDIEKYCIDNFKFYLIAGTGRFVNTHFDLHLSYTDAKTCILYKFLKPDQYAFNYEHVSLISQNKVTLDDNNPKKLRKYLNMENIASIEKLVAQFLDYIESDKILYHDAKKEISRYVKVYTQYISEKKIKLDDIADEETKIRFTSPVSANDFIETFIQLIKSTFSYTSNKKLNKNSILAEKAKQYVLENIHMDLSLISAASAFNISPYHFSRIFKEENGISYIDYVVNCKIAKAKELLRNSNLSVDEITNRVGYSHSTYFSRKFKEITGITPIEYRNSK